MLSRAIPSLVPLFCFASILSFYFSVSTRAPRRALRDARGIGRSEGQGGETKRAESSFPLRVAV